MIIFTRFPRTLLCVVIGMCLNLLATGQAAKVEAKSAAFEDVSSAVGRAQDGDTVTVPAGTATWTTGLNIDKNITVQGAGAGSTVIIDGILSTAKGQPPETGAVPRAVGKEAGRRGEGRNRVVGRPNARGPGRVGIRRSQSFLIRISLVRDLPFRMTGFTFKGGTQGAATANGVITIRGNCHSFRIDHCTFDQLHGTNLGTAGFLWGVIDHCRFTLAGQQPIHVGHDTWNGGDHGNGSWADDPYWGSEKFVFIEDNVFDNTAGIRRAIDGYEGARLVVRHNQFHNSGVSVHGTEGQGRGAKQVEEYNNIYRVDSPQAAGQIRSGCIITHDNTWINVKRGHVLQAYRQFHYSPHWGIANGQNPYDDNAPKAGTGYWETGKHTGSEGATVLTDSTKNWAVNQWYAPGASFIVRNMTQKAVAANDVDKLQSFAISNTANTITCSALSFNAQKRLIFNTGDTYQIWKVVHSLDQPGLGKGELLAGLPGRPAMWPKQVTEPCYSWNNISKEDGRAIDLSSTEPSIKEGRDFFNDTPKPGYKPYVYPHPLVK
jgi:hypothetical protein